MPDYMNDQRPPVIPVKPMGEPRDVIARLVLLDGTERRVPARAVRFTPTHTMVKVGVDYCWLQNCDVWSTSPA